MSDIFRDFDKKNEIPKVKIPKFATGGICNDAIFFNLDAFPQIDEIVKDIRCRQDNAMAMEFTKCIVELLRKNGVVPKISEYRMENHAENHTENKIEMRYGVSIDGLDFTEHDKVFEDKIARLEENVGYYKDSLSRVEKNCDKLYHENKELKQHIAELESKEAEKPTKINLNDRVKVKLTPLGAEIYYHQYDELNKQIKERGGKQLEPIMPEIDKDGFTEIQLWHFMELYGEHIGMCKPNVIEPLNIVVAE